MYCPVPDKKKTKEKSVFLCTAPFLKKKSQQKNLVFYVLPRSCDTLTYTHAHTHTHTHTHTHVVCVYMYILVLSRVVSTQSTVRGGVENTLVR